MPPATSDAELRSFRNNESAFRCTLTVVFQHQIAWNTVGLKGSRARRGEPLRRDVLDELSQLAPV